jgi:hypothetical protein
MRVARWRVPRVQFSLRVLLVLVALAGVGSWWFTQRLESARAQAAAVQQLRSAGAMLYYDFEVDHDLNFVAGRPRDSFDPPPRFSLSRVLGDDFFSDVTVVNSWEMMDDSQLQTVADCRNVRALLLGIPLSERSLPILKRMTSLKLLDIQGSGLSESAIRELQAALPRTRIYHDSNPRQGPWGNVRGEY